MSPRRTARLAGSIALILATALAWALLRDGERSRTAGEPSAALELELNGADARSAVASGGSRHVRAEVQDAGAVPASVASMVGRCIDEEGRALAGVALELCAERSGERRAENLSSSSDAEGRFRFDLDGDDLTCVRLFARGADRERARLDVVPRSG